MGELLCISPDTNSLAAPFFVWFVCLELVFKVRCVTLGTGGWLMGHWLADERKIK